HARRIRGRPAGGARRARRRPLHAARVRRDVAGDLRVPRGRTAADRGAGRRRARGAHRRRARGAGTGRRRPGPRPGAGAARGRSGGGVPAGRGRTPARRRAVLRSPRRGRARSALREPRDRRGRVKVSVLAADLSDNATGRADLLARLLSARYEVEVIGPCFGAEVWMPARDGAIAQRSVAVGRYPGFARRIPALLDLVDGDVLVASKPRPTSFGLGLLARARRRRPLVLDIDDWEVGFFSRSGVWGRV